MKAAAPCWPQGLGALPKNLPSVSSLLLFNRVENPYKKYVTIDPLQGAVTKTRADMEEQAKMGDAPSTILSGQQYQMQVGGCGTSAYCSELWALFLLITTCLAASCE